MAHGVSDKISNCLRNGAQVYCVSLRPLNGTGRHFDYIMSNGNKEFILSVRDRSGLWGFYEETVDGKTAIKGFRTVAAAQREGSLMLNAKEIDAFEIYKKVAAHH